MSSPKPMGCLRWNNITAPWLFWLATLSHSSGFQYQWEEDNPCPQACNQDTYQRQRKWRKSKSWHSFLQDTWYQRQQSLISLSIPFPWLMLALKGEANQSMSCDILCFTTYHEAVKRMHNDTAFGSPATPSSILTLVLVHHIKKLGNIYLVAFISGNCPKMDCISGTVYKGGKYALPPDYPDAAHDHSTGMSSPCILTGIHKIRMHHELLSALSALPSWVWNHIQKQALLPVLRHSPFPLFWVIITALLLSVTVICLSSSWARCLSNQWGCNYRHS